MKGLKPFLSLGMGLFVLMLLAGCASHAPANSPGALNIAQFTLSDGVVGLSYKQLLIASGGLTPYTWTISAGALPPGLSLSTDGLITGTPTQDPNLTYPQTYNFTAKVVDSQTPVAAYNSLSTSITIQPVLTLASVTLPTGTVNVPGYSATISASGGLAPYTWAVAFGSLPAGLTLDPVKGIISGTPTDAGEYTFTIQVSDADSEVATAVFTLTVVGRLQGNYAFTFNGYDNGTPFYTVGTFCADGNGNINPTGNSSCPGSANSCNGGATGIYTLDQSGPSGVSTCVPFTGTYNVPTGSNFGTVTLVSSLGTYVYTVVISSTADSKFILADPTNHPTAWGSGLVKKQTAMALSLTGSVTNYSFGFFGNDTNGNRDAGAGMFAINTSFAVTGGEEDTNDNGTVTPMIPINGGTVGAPDANTGRAVLSLTTASGTTNYAYYVVSPTELVAVGTDASAPQTLLDILQQQQTGVGGLTVCKPSPPANNCQSALEFNGSSTGTAVPEAQIGVVTFDGSGNIARTDGLPGYYADQNLGGAISTVSYSAGTYSLDATCGSLTTCGRVTVTLPGDLTPPVWYLVAPGQAFSVGTDTNAVISGTVQPQSGGPFTIASLLGSYLGGTITPVLPVITNEVDVEFTPPPGGTLDITYDNAGPSGFYSGLTYNGLPYDCGTLGQPACTAMGTAFGRFEVTNPDDNGQLTILYLVSGSAGATGSKTGVVEMNVGDVVGTVGSGSKTVVDTHPRLTVLGR